MNNIILSLCPKSLFCILFAFSTCLSKKAFFPFCILVLGWILCLGNHTIARILIASGSIAAGWHHAPFYRFLSVTKWSVDAIGKRIFMMLLPWLPDVIEAPIDDTLHRRSGPHIFGAGMHYDAKNSSYGRSGSKKPQTSFAFGHNWVVLSIYLPLPWNPESGFALPVLFRFYRSKKNCPTDLYKKRTELAVELIHILASWLPKHPSSQLHILGDSGYCCKTVLKNLPPRTHFTGPIPMDAALFEAPPEYAGKGRPPQKGPRLPSPKEMANSTDTPWQSTTINIYNSQARYLFKTTLALWYYSAGDSLGRVVLTRDPKGQYEDRAYFSTNPKLTAQQSIIGYSHRWPLESTFHDAKQFMGIEDPQNGWWRRNHHDPVPPKQPGPNPHPTRGELAAKRTFPLGFICYDIVIIWFLLNGIPDTQVQQAKIQAPWYRTKENPSFPDMLAALRREIWLARFFANPSLRRVRQKLMAALPPWLWYP